MCHKKKILCNNIYKDPKKKKNLRGAEQRNGVGST